MPCWTTCLWCVLENNSTAQQARLVPDWPPARLVCQERPLLQYVQSWTDGRWTDSAGQDQAGPCHRCSTLGPGWVPGGCTYRVCAVLGPHPSAVQQEDSVPSLWLGGQGWAKIPLWVCQAPPHSRVVTEHTQTQSLLLCERFYWVGHPPRKVPLHCSQHRAPLPPGQAYMRNLERSSLISASSHGPWMLSLSC